MLKMRNIAQVKWREKQSSRLVFINEKSTQARQGGARQERGQGMQESCSFPLESTGLCTCAPRLEEPRSGRARLSPLRSSMSHSSPAVWAASLRPVSESGPASGSQRSLAPPLPLPQSVPGVSAQILAQMSPGCFRLVKASWDTCRLRPPFQGTPLTLSLFTQCGTLDCWVHLLDYCSTAQGLCLFSPTSESLWLNSGIPQIFGK